MSQKSRVDGYLSRRVQQLWPRGLVYCRTLHDGVEEWALVRPGEPDLGLGNSFGRAQDAVHALRSAHGGNSVN
jgi:hypothetical protein